MITVTRRSYIEAATPQDIFLSLSDPNRIGQLLPRMQKVEMSNFDELNCKARLVTYMSLGGIFGTIRCEGDLTWVEPSEILFKVQTPLPVETRWMLNDALNGTEIEATMSINLEPMLGPMSAFVPVQTVSDILAKELESALNSIKEGSARRIMRERAVAA